MSGKVLFYEEISSYSPILSVNQKAFLKKDEKQTLFSNESTAFFYIAYRLFLIFILSLAVYHSLNFTFTFILITILVIPLFISIVDRGLYNFAIREIAFSSRDSFLYKFALEEANGWYDDPYANGLPNQQREWVAGKWTKNIRIFTTQSRENGTY